MVITLSNEAQEQQRRWTFSIGRPTAA
jgi:hypothetical protein